MEEKFSLHRQSFGFSCGPAALLMVLKDLDPDIVADMYAEVSIWREANLVESRSTSAYGLALAAIRRGFSASVSATDRSIGFHRTLKRHFPQIDPVLLDRVQEDLVRQALEMRVQERSGRIGSEDLGRSLQNGRRPIVLISTSLMGEMEEIPHWIVLLSMDRDHVSIANPETGSIERYRRDRFERALGFDGYIAFIEIWKVKEWQEGRTRRV